MFSWRCGACGTHWPPVLAETCPICKRPTTPSQVEPSPEWRDNITEHARVNAPSDPFPSVKGELTKLGRKTWALKVWDVINSGVQGKLADDTVVRVETEAGEVYVEVKGYSYHDRIYIVRLFKTRWPTDAKGRAFVPKRWK